MWILDSNRRDLTEMLLGNGIGTYSECRFSEHFPTHTPSGDNIYLVWDSKPEDKAVLPSIIIVADGHLRDFLAWATTYFLSYRPFTAYFRVLEFQTLESLKHLLHPPSLEGIEAACVGLIIAESLLLSFGMEKPVPLTPATCSSTISYALARALALGASYNQLDIISEKWLVARKLTGQPDRKVEAVAVREIFKIPFLLNSQIHQKTIVDADKLVSITKIVDASWEIKRDGKISDVTWYKLTNGIEELKTAHRQMESSREERVRYFVRLLAENIFTRLPKDVGAFICAYLVSLIAPGSLSHIDLVSRYGFPLPTTSIWYGLCAGLYKKNELLSSYNGLGRRLLRDLLRYEPFLAPPVSDIAISELQVLLEGNGKAVEFCTFTSNRAIVELQPCVSTYLMWPRHGAKQETTQQISLFRESGEPGFRDKLHRELGSHLKQALDIYRRLNEPTPSEPSRTDKADPKQKRKKKQ
jgi:hypothetical protein